MKIKSFYIFLAMLALAACGSPGSVEEPQANQQQSFPTLAAPSGTVVKNDASNLVLSHPEFNWTVTLPDNWIIAYDAGFQINANNPDKTIFMRLQAQRWAQESDRLPDARAYVEHWKNFAYGNIFPLFADGKQVSEVEISPDKFGGPYLQYDFDNSAKKIRYVQVYASAGGPGSAMVTTWTTYDEYDKAQKTMQTIINSFELLENAQ